MSTSAQELFTSYGNCSKNTYGFVNIENRDKNIPPKYCDVNRFSEGLAAIKNEEKWGYIDANNNEVIALQFDGARHFKKGQAIVRQGQFYGVINKKGKYIIQPVYHDLSPIEVEGQLYYIARDVSFFSGVIDSKGQEVLPHQFTYIITLDAYDNIPFYTIFQELDTAKGSFYDQFSENAYQFSPEIGRHDLYDLQFNKLASRNSTNYAEGFQHYELDRINTSLEENQDKSSNEKIKIIHHLLTLPQTNTDEIKPNTRFLEYQTMNHEEVNKHLDSLGYMVFNNADRKTGLKKGGNILVPAQYDHLKLVNGIVVFPFDEDVPYLQQNYGGSYRNKGKGIFDIFFAVAGNDTGTKIQLYNLNGKKILPANENEYSNKRMLTGISSVGFNYLSLTKNDLNQTIEKHGLISWKGEELLTPKYNRIDVLKTGHLLIMQEKQVKEGIEEHIGLYNKSGEPIIPMGIYSEIKPCYQVDNLYLATWDDHYPTVADKNKTKDGNRNYVILQVKGNSYTVINNFNASFVSTQSLDIETGMLQYKQNKEIR